MGSDELKGRKLERLPGMKTGRVRTGLFRYSATELLIALVLLFVFTPVVQELPHGRIVETVLMTLVLFSAVLAVGSRRRTMIFAACLAAPALAGRWLYHIRPDIFPPSVFFALAPIFIAYVVFHLLSYVLRSRRVTGEVLCASIAAYLLIGVIWTVLYGLVGAIDSGAFAFSSTHDKRMEGFNAFYLSFVTLCTVGYGDITPVSRVARMLVVMEAMIGVFYVAVLIARLVAIYSTERPPHPKAPDDADFS